MPDEAPNEQAEAKADSGERAGDFERYALIAALTLVVLCLLVWDRRQDGAAPSSPGPRPDRALRVEIGGTPTAASKPPSPHVSIDPPPRPAPTPAPTPAPAPAPEQRTYVVKGGDTLEAIARRELGSPARVKDIVDLNGIADPAALKVGQVLKLPAK
jgi:nucleoid-associated protein YgaU